MTALPKLRYQMPMQLTESILVELLERPTDVDKPPGWGASRFAVPTGASTPAHSHTSTEVWFIKAGAGEMVCDGETFSLEGGDAIYLASNKIHTVHNNGSATLEIFSIWWT